MADNDKILPDSGELDETVRSFKQFRDHMSKSSDLAAELLSTFKNINGIVDETTKSVDKMRSFQKELLKGTQGDLAASKIRASISQQINNAEEELVEMRLAQIDNTIYLNKLSFEYLKVQKKIKSTRDLIEEAEEKLTEATLSTTKAEEDKAAVLTRQVQILSAINEKKRAIQKVDGSIKINQDAILENKKKQESVDAQLKALESEMDTAQLRSIHEGIDLSEEYSSMMKKREFLQKKLNDLSVVGNQYSKDGERLETRRSVLQTALLKAQDNWVDSLEEASNVEERLLEAKSKQTAEENNLKNIQATLNGLLEEKANLEKSMASPDEAIKARIKELETQIQQNQQTDKALTKQRGFVKYLQESAKSSGGVLGNLSGMANQATEMVDKFKTIPSPFLILVMLIKEGLDLFVKLDKAAENFRKETGFSNTQMAELRKNAEAVNREFQKYGVSIEDTYKAAKALTDVFGRTSLVTKEALGNVALLSANLGVAEADSANVLANFQGLGGATEKAAMNVIKVGAGISEKTGVPFKLVMNDIANASEQTTSMLGANPSKLMKSAIAARALGSDMNKIVSSQRKLLDYSSSINDELELSALLGKSVSFQKARQLAYQGDIVGAAKATLETVKRAGDFDKMSVYQREALAKASGMELKDLTKMMAVEKQRDAILLNGTDEQKKKLLAQEAELESLKKKASLDDEDLVRQNEKALMQQKMQGLVSQLSNMWDSIKLAIGSVLEPIIRVVVGVLVPAFRMIGSLVEGLLAPFRDLYDEISDILGEGNEFKEYIEEVGVALEQYVLPTFKFIGTVISTVIVGALKVVGGLVGAIFGTIASLFDPTVSIGDALLGGLEAVKDLVLNAIVYPFKKAWNWLLDTFMGKSPSELGLAIVKGIASIGSMLINALLWPFKKVWEFVSGLFSGDGDIAASIIDGITYVGGMFLDILTWPFRTVLNFVSDLFSGDGSVVDTIVGGIKIAAGFVFDIMTMPFRTVTNFISKIFGGDGELGTMIVEGIKTAASFIFDIIVSPFKKAFDFVKNLPLVGKLFGGSDDISKQAKPPTESFQNVETSSVIEVKYLDELRDVVAELTSAVANLGTKTSETATVGGTMNTSALEAKLDTLTNLLVGGAVRVYLDGKDVSAAMSATGR